MTPLCGSAGQMIYLVYAVQGGPQVTLIVEADHCHFHGDAFRAGAAIAPVKRITEGM